MNRREAQLPEVLSEVVGGGASTATVQERAAEILQRLERILAFDAAWLAVRDR